MHQEIGTRAHVLRHPPGILGSIQGLDRFMLESEGTT